MSKQIEKDTAKFFADQEKKKADFNKDMAKKESALQKKLDKAKTDTLKSELKKYL